MPVNNKLKLF